MSVINLRIPKNANVTVNLIADEETDDMQSLKDRIAELEKQVALLTQENSDLKKKQIPEKVMEKVPTKKLFKTEKEDTPKKVVKISTKTSSVERTLSLADYQDISKSIFG